MELPWRLAQQDPSLPLDPGVSGELIEARAFDMWAGGEWPLWPPAFCLCCRMTEHLSPEAPPSVHSLWLEHLPGFGKGRERDRRVVRGMAWPLTPVGPFTYLVTLGGCVPGPIPALVSLFGERVGGEGVLCGA